MAAKACKVEKLLSLNTSYYESLHGDPVWARGYEPFLYFYTCVQLSKTHIAKIGAEKRCDCRSTRMIDDSDVG